jgi:hypothetical protein
MEYYVITTVNFGFLPLYITNTYIYNVKIYFLPLSNMSAFAV